MTSKATDPRITRYFRTFSAHRHPVQPQEQIEYSEAQELSTYYEARYDEKERLVEFIKQLRTDDESENKWGIMFTEVYQYFDSGNLQQRTLKIPGQTDQVWDFTKDRKSWSIYFDRLCDRWFGRSSHMGQQSPAQLSLLVHEQITELEAEVFEASVGVPHDKQWAFNITLRILDGVRDIIKEIEPNSAPKICAIAIGQEDGLQLEGFDAPEPSLYGVVESWREEHSDVNELETITLLAQRDLDQMGQLWAANSNISSITFAPMRAVDEEHLATAAMLYLVTTQTLTEENICVVNSIFRRLLQQLQDIVEMARSYETSNQGSNWP